MNKENIAGIILAGGRASRMGYADKPLLILQGKPLLQHIIGGARDQVSLLLLNVNRNLEAYAPFGLPLVQDSAAHADGGPLAGIEAAMRWLEHSATPPITHLACFPGDTPYFSKDAVSLMARHLSSEAPNAIAWLCTGKQLQPLFSLWPRTMLPTLRAALRSGQYSPRYFIEAQANVLVHLASDFPTHYLNINDADSLARAEQLASEQH